MALCAVCESPSASTLHFGARTCKACAAFFRRTVSMAMNYKCVSKHGEKCRIHYELRMICRQCRYAKCIYAGMQHDLVQTRKDTNSPPGATDIARPVPTSSLNSSSSIVPDEPAPIPQLPSPCTLPMTGGRTVPDMKPDWTDSPGSSASAFTQCTPSPDNRCSEVSSSCTPVAHFVRRSLERAEKALMDRRRILYTNCRLDDIFKRCSPVPYNRDNLRPFLFTEFHGLTRPDLVMLFDYCQALPGFDQLSEVDRTTIYRFSTVVDAVVGGAYLTALLAKDQEFLVLTDGSYICMDPLPMTGEEPDAAAVFSSPHLLEKYKVFIPMKVRQYTDVVPPMRELGLSFDEFALFKALVIWHISESRLVPPTYTHYRLTPDGRRVCEEQRNIIVAALHRISRENGFSPEQRVGNMLLAMSTIIEITNILIESYVKIAFFELANLDPLIKNMVEMVYGSDETTA